MAMFIHAPSFGDKDSRKAWYQWHYSEPIPPLVHGDRVVTFQADGDELRLILDAMRRTGQGES